MEFEILPEAVWARLEHFTKNKMQVLLAGGFLVESGLRSKDFAAVDRGWQIVNKNQTAITRCIQHLLSLGQPPSKLEPCDTGQLVSDTVLELKESAHRDGMDVAGLSMTIKQSCVCWLNPQSMRSALFGLMRICLEAGRDNSGSETRVQVVDHVISVVCSHPQFDLDSITLSSQATDEFEMQSREGLWIDWMVAQIAVKRVGGSLEAVSGLSEFEFRIALPTAIPESR